ncbi:MULTISPECIES: hypothetical protein [unclassified Nodularia (in: cyanobacteria)]|uniref:DUF7925 domain-containing protein n=1 Tax=unclassified Nodularia (in: cyanobacteria) TaxID=2656917 RepID=UPI0018825CE9|nr:MULTISPECIES: hypothetical protein [unclassified Nodularia (in: cyanobacteria)]MBE9201186.1 hypothetical protein [Nodularia sp. LEGE 06071]MCC2693735.1 hypothetical protein [Nodularia sp. LEGE 04288]
MNHSQRKQSKFYRSLIATALLAGSFFEFALPVIAEGTAAGESISNTATATYEDPNNPGETINSTSNTVVVTVAEVAGITVAGLAVNNVTNPGEPPAPTNTLNYEYTVTNVGNDPTRIRIPNSATVTGPGTAGTVQVSENGGTTWVDVTDPNFLTNSIPAGGSVLVRVPVIVNAGANQGEDITVQLGNTPANGQNLLRDPQPGDVYTEDNPDPSAIPGEVVGLPVNGVREASATQTATVNVPDKPYALATVLKTRGTYTDQGTPAITDDTLNYGLSLRVENTDPTNNGITPTALVGTTINLNGTNQTHILVSDAIPLNTQLAAIPTAPAGWQVVYTTTPVTTNANQALWTTSDPGDLSTVTRIGFINIPGTITSVAPGTTVTGFSLQVKVRDAVTALSVTVNNIAQLFGQTDGVTPVDGNGDSVPDNLVYDESGDQNPSNYNGVGSIPLGSTDPNGDGIPDTTPTISDGYINDPADLTNTGTDTNNNNTGTGPSGEANTFEINAPANVLNGPDGVPAAVGPTDNNDDFTNQSAAVPVGLAPGSTFNPDAVVFTNTVQNNGGATAPISLVPTPPATPGDLPTGTEVTITANGDTRTYVWNGTVFTIGGNPIDDTSDYITIPNVAPGATVNYTVTVNLPANTPLSTDIDRGFPVPVTAFVDDATPGVQSEPQNTTIDRVYTGFLKLVKESRILQGDVNAPAVQGTDGTFSTTQKQPAPGNIIEYRITYSNISDVQAGTGNVILTAGSVVIVEDGVTAPNNWALDNDGNTEIDTSNVVGSAQASSGIGTINFFNGNPATNPVTTTTTGTTVNTDVTRYTNNVGTVVPNADGTFTFQRRVN